MNHMGNCDSGATYIRGFRVSKNRNVEFFIYDQMEFKI